MKVIPKLIAGVAILALIPVASSDQLREELDSWSLFAGAKGDPSLAPSKSSRPRRFSADIRLEEFLEEHQPHYRFKGPAEDYVAGWTKMREANEPSLSNPDRLQLLAEASSLLRGVALAEPEWKPDLVQTKLIEIKAEVRQLLIDEEVSPSQIDDGLTPTLEQF